MAHQYNALPTTIMARGTTCYPPDPAQGNTITDDSPACETMTNLKSISAITIEPDARLHEANQKMITGQVRLLFVTDAADHILGIITTTDTLGEKPVQFMHRVDCCYKDICVQDIMPPRMNWKSCRWSMCQKPALVTS